MSNVLIKHQENRLDLLIRPRPILNESAIGYLSRVAERNCLASLQALGDLYRGDQNFIDWDSFFKSIGVSDQVMQYLFGPLPQSWQVTSTLRGIAAVEFNHLYRRWCPLCIQGEAYFRGVWGLKISCICINHACYLIECCEQCKKDQSWQCSNVSVCMHCGAALQKAAPQAASSMMVTLQRALVANLIGTRSNLFPQLDTNGWLRLIRYLGQFNGAKLPQRPGQISGLHHLDVAKECMHNVAHLLTNWPQNFELFLQAIQTSIIPTSSLKKTFGVLYRVLYFHLRDDKFQFLRDAFEHYLHQHWWGIVCKRNRAFKPTTITAHPRLTLKQAAKQTGLAPSLIRHLSTSNLIDKNHINLPSGRQVSSFHQADLPHLEALAKDLLNLQTTAQYLAVSERLVREFITAKIIHPLAILKHANMANWIIPRQQLQHLCLKCIPNQDKDLISFSGIVKYWRLREGEMVHLIKALISGELSAFDVSNHSVVIGSVKLDKAAAKEWLWALRKSLNAVSIDEAAKLMGIKQQVAYHLVKVGLIQSIQTKQAGKQITKEAIAAFNHKYVALSVIAEQQQTSSSALLKTLKVKPVTGPLIDGSRQYFYLRKHITPRKVNYESQVKVST